MYTHEAFRQLSSRVPVQLHGSFQEATASEGGGLLVLAGIPDLGLQDERSIAVMIIFWPGHKVYCVSRAQPVQEEVQPLTQGRRLRPVLGCVQRFGRVVFLCGVDHRELHAVAAVWVHLVRQIQSFQSFLSLHTILACQSSIMNFPT